MNKNIRSVCFSTCSNQLKNLKINRITSGSLIAEMFNH